MSKLAVPPSILDTDLYKSIVLQLTMQQAVLHHFPSVQASYRFTNRDKPKVTFSRACYERLKAAVSEFHKVQLTQDERNWLSEACPFFTQQYLDYLQNYRFKPEQVDIQFTPANAADSDSQDPNTKGHIDIMVKGLWEETILWEVPLMACLSETYFLTDDQDWNYDGQEELAFQKAKTLIEAGCAFNEFGTRRRRSYRNQDIVVKGVAEAAQKVQGGGKLLGTSNVVVALNVVHLAQRYGLRPTGTVAHEWFMGIGALKGYETVHEQALSLWEESYPNALLLALTDTFSTQAFFQRFVKMPERAKRWDGLRQDSGDPFVYAPRAKEIYAAMGIDHTQKLIIYSDGLDIDKSLALKKLTDEVGFKSAFGIGTFMTNDFRKASSDGKEKSKALNIVIKLASVEGKPCVKISDELTKTTGDTTTAEHVKKLYGLSVTQ
ncbi:nicotinate phosphoribosyltransferase [Paramarasmius palmivorus]|uniref:Nicotinate phosphoribosyltransferase n=1 Tax=Paramarasmius palmivorus TaxID=297713 RepID=A0AAW0DIV0_9AGAR